MLGPFYSVLVHPNPSISLIPGLENHPSIPLFPGSETATFPILHNNDIRTADDLPDDDILIVGGGPSSMDISEEAAITKGAKHVTLASRKPHLGLPDKWGPLVPWATGAKWFWDRGITEIRVLYRMYLYLPVSVVDWWVNKWSAAWAKAHSISEWIPVGTIPSNCANIRRKILTGRSFRVPDKTHRTNKAKSLVCPSNPN
jgi:hypothetical protein